MISMATSDNRSVDLYILIQPCVCIITYINDLYLQMLDLICAEQNLFFVFCLIHDILKRSNFRIPGQMFALSLDHETWLHGYFFSICVFSDHMPRGYMTTQLHGYWLHDYLDTWLRGYMATWLYGYMASWIHGYVATWLHGFVDTWLRGYVATWLRGYMATCNIYDYLST